MGGHMNTHEMVADCHGTLGALLAVDGYTVNRVVLEYQMFGIETPVCGDALASFKRNVK